MECFRDRKGTWYPYILITSVRNDPYNPRDYEVDLCKRASCGLHTPRTVHVRKSRLKKYLEVGVIPAVQESELLVA